MCSRTRTCKSSRVMRSSLLFAALQVALPVARSVGLAIRLAVGLTIAPSVGLAVGLAACGSDESPAGDDSPEPRDGGMMTGDVTVRDEDSAVGEDGNTSPPFPQMCSERLTSLVFNGTPEPTAMPLTAGQILAIGEFGGCSGTFVTDHWVITARHCGVARGNRFCIGEDPQDADQCFTAMNVFDHPQVDMSLVELEIDATNRPAGLMPIPINNFELDETIFGEIAEAAGYGRQEDGVSGEREFTAEPIDGFEQSFLVINGMGERGVCFGDSGGPVMIMAEDGSVRVAGVLSWGDPSCVGRDRYTRTDLVVDWIETHTGPTVVEGGACGVLTDEGRCIGDAALWCENEVVNRESCNRCGWSNDAAGYRCITEADPCDGVGNVGECRDDVAVWCDRGTLRRRDCGECDELVCGIVDELGGAYCREDPCMGVDFQGECDGDVARWCDDGELRQRDCGRRGLRCDFVNERIGYFCTR